jgi:hypothetical protein
MPGASGCGRGIELRQTGRMDPDLEELLREMWADLAALRRGEKALPAVDPERRLEPLDLEPLLAIGNYPVHKTRLDRIEERLARLEKHFGLDPL